VVSVNLKNDTPTVRKNEIIMWAYKLHSVRFPRASWWFLKRNRMTLFNTVGWSSFKARFGRVVFYRSETASLINLLEFIE